MQDVLLEIPVDEIFKDDSFNVRGIVSPDAYIQLSHDIQRNGLIQPVVVQHWDEVPGKKYRILAGHCRYMACCHIGWEKIPCIVKSDVSAVQAAAINWSENLKRTDLSEWQQAQALKKMLDSRFMTEGQIQHLLGVDSNWINDRILLANSEHTIQAAFTDGFFNFKHVRTLAAIKDQGKRERAAEALKKKIIRGEKVDIRKLVERPTRQKIVKVGEMLSAEQVRGMADKLAAVKHGCREHRILLWVLGYSPGQQEKRLFDEVVADTGYEYDLTFEDFLKV